MQTDLLAETALEDRTGADSPDALASHFDLLSDESRLEIIGALYRAGSHSPSDPIPFSDLFDRTGLTDTGQFNYHLRRLRGPFVEKTDDGYCLTTEGATIGRLLDQEHTTDDGSSERVT